MMAEDTDKNAKAPEATAEQKGPVARSAELSEAVLKSVESGQRAAIEAVRKFVDKVDEALPATGDRSSRRDSVIDAALDMADKLVAAQYDFLRHVVRDAASSLSKPDNPQT
jgi:hypothetical protein